MISLITATYGRVEELRLLLDSLCVQTYKDFELIIVDQNPHELLKKLVVRYEHVFSIKYIRSAVKGLSYNRNIGLKYCQGEIIGFPDDDCYYDAKVLEQVVATFSLNLRYILAVAEVKDLHSKEVFIKRHPGTIHRRQMFQDCISYNFFIKKSNDMQFDERLGIGAYWGSGEETDFLWEYTKGNNVGGFLTNVYVHHPKNGASMNYQRAYSYGLGFGALFKKEVVYRKHYSYAALFVYHIGRTIGGCIVRRNRLFYYYTLLGRVKGFISYRKL